MKNVAGKKLVFGLLVAITAVALCALPFFGAAQNVVYVYAKTPTPDSIKRDFVNELSALGYKVVLNDKSFPKKNTIAIWFKPPEFAGELTKSAAQYDFLYSSAYYPFVWRGKSKLPIVLTPHKDLYEHYARANIKTALIDIPESPDTNLNHIKKAAQKIDAIIKWLQHNDIH